MLTGGVVAAPLAAYVVRYLPPRAMGLAVAGLLLLTQSREIAGAADLPGNRWMAYLGVLGALVVASFRPRIALRLRHRRYAGAPAI